LFFHVHCVRKTTKLWFCAGLSRYAVDIRNRQIILNNILQQLKVWQEWKIDVLNLLLQSCLKEDRHVSV
jgi:hypothetical protein